MTEMSPLGTLAVPPAAAEQGSEEYWRYRATQGRLRLGVEARLVGPDGERAAVGRRERRRARGPRPVDHRRPTTRTAPRTSRPAQMAAKFDDGWLRTGDVGALTAGRLPRRSPTGPRTSSSPAASGSARSTSRTRSWPTPTSSRPPSSACPTSKWGERPLATVVRRGGPERRRSSELRDFLAGQGRALAGAGAVGLHRRGAQDERRQVRQEGAAQAVRRGRAGGRDPGVAGMALLPLRPAGEAADPGGSGTSRTRRSLGCLSASAPPATGGRSAGVLDAVEVVGRRGGGGAAGGLVVVRCGVVGRGCCEPAPGASPSGPTGGSWRSPGCHGAMTLLVSGRLVILPLCIRWTRVTQAGRSCWGMSVVRCCSWRRGQGGVLAEQPTGFGLVDQGADHAALAAHPVVVVAC